MGRARPAEPRAGAAARAGTRRRSPSIKIKRRTLSSSHAVYYDAPAAWEHVRDFPFRLYRCRIKVWPEVGKVSRSRRRSTWLRLTTPLRLAVKDTRPSPLN